MSSTSPAPTAAELSQQPSVTLCSHPAHRSLCCDFSVLIAERYERRILAITANTPFSEWGAVFPEPAMTVAAIDRLVHHATILEMNVEGYRRRAARPR